MQNGNCEAMHIFLSFTPSIEENAGEHRKVAGLGKQRSDGRRRDVIECQNARFRTRGNRRIDESTNRKRPV
jgi:hypothetical protein